MASSCDLSLQHAGWVLKGSVSKREHTRRRYFKKTRKELHNLLYPATEVALPHLPYSSG